MKIDFGNCIYYDPTRPDDSDLHPHDGTKSEIIYGKRTEEYAFNYNNLYDTAITNKQYTEAYNHASKFHFKDAEVEDNYKNDLIGLRNDGRVTEAIYSKIVDKNDREAIDFADMVGVNGGLELLDSKNEYVKNFVSLKRDLGGEGSTKLRLRFDKKERNLFGWEWTDFLVKDNPYGWEDFLAALGMDETALESEGIKPVIGKDGSTTIEFDKSHPYANKIIYAIPHRAISGKVWDSIANGVVNPSNFGIRTNNPFATINPFTTSINFAENVLRGTRDTVLGRRDQNGLPLTSDQEYGIHITGLNDNNEEVSSSNNGDWTLRQIKSLIKGTRETKDKYSQILSEPKEYSSTIGPVLNIEMERLKAMNLDRDEFLKQAKLLNTKWDNFLSTAAWEDYDIYTNNGEASTDATLRKLENDVDKQEIMQKLAAANPGDLKFNAMISNGKAGVLITLDRANTDSDVVLDLNKEKRTMVFIPDDGKSSIFNDVTNAINKDPRVRAANEVNRLQDWGYKYDLYGNKGSIQYAGTVNNKPRFRYINEYNQEQIISAKNVEQIIARDNFIEHYATNIIDQYVTKNNQLITTPNDPLGGARAYEQLVREAAVATVENIYPDVPLMYADRTPVEIKDVLNFLWGSNDTVRAQWLNNFNFEQQTKLIDMLKTYNELFSVLQYYGIFNIDQLKDTTL